jgi:1-acyl-sn-glycerol-3-phosphate acyltransferase
MNRHHLYKYSISYALLKKYVRMVHSIYYSEICIITPENVPSHEPVIFAPNHQNALMDALAILLLVDKQPVFMARADIFKKKTIHKILTFLKIIPVYRIRDGVTSLSNNNESFGIALRALGYGQAVAIMPEGNHGDKHLLRPLKKGLVRFALNAQENFGDTVPVNIIPVGIEYSNYNEFRGKLLVIFGKPINVTEYLSSYKENPQHAFNSLRDRLAGEMKKNMLHIENPEFYNLIIKIKDLYAPRLQQMQELDNTYYFRFLAEKQITEKLVTLAKENPSLLESLGTSIDQYLSRLKRFKLSDWVFDAQKPETKTLYFDIFRYLFFLPFFLLGTAVNFIPYSLCNYVSKGVKDTQFRSSIKFVLIAFIFPLWYLLFLMLPIPLITRLILLLPWPILGILSYDFYQGLLKQWKIFLYFRALRKNNQELADLRQLREHIFSTLNQLF